MTRGAVGCFLSHRKALEAAAAFDGVATFVFEDDTILMPDMLRRYYALGPVDCDLLLLGCSEQQPLKNEPDGKTRRLKHFFGLYAYVVTPVAAKKILTFIDGPISKQLDSVLSDAAEDGRLCVAVAVEQIAGHDFEFVTSVQSPIRAMKGVDVWAKE
jgi:hypothetical protein